MTITQPDAGRVAVDEREDCKGHMEDEATTPTTDDERPPGGDDDDVFNNLADISDCDSDFSGTDCGTDNGNNNDDIDCTGMDCSGDDGDRGASASSASPSQLLASEIRLPPRSPTAPQYDDTLLIFDWDDTLLPTTYLQRHGFTLNGPAPTDEQWLPLKELSLSAGRTLRAAKKRGNVVIVTNAERGWVELSCRKFSPWLLPDLEGVKILSARTQYEQDGVTSPFQWKCLAFEDEIASFFGQIVGGGCGDASCPMANVVSIGDAGHERMALLHAAKGAPNCRAKSIKLVERPDPAQMLKQNDLLCQTLKQICLHEGSLDLCFKFV